MAPPMELGAGEDGQDAERAERLLDRRGLWKVTK